MFTKSPAYSSMMLISSRTSDAELSLHNKGTVLRRRYVLCFPYVTELHVVKFEDQNTEFQSSRPPLTQVRGESYLLPGPTLPGKDHRVVTGFPLLSVFDRCGYPGAFAGRAEGTDENARSTHSKKSPEAHLSIHVSRG